MLASSLLCLSLVVWTEARGEPTKGQVAVASVVMNRVEMNNSSVCDEVTKPAQFPWARNIIKKRDHDYYVPEKNIPHDPIWEKSVELATAVLDGTQEIIPRITHFHNIFEFPNWHLKKELVVGRHIFYRYYV
jgi:spore germination cell wall hydrolase CwlJ-like protein